MALAALAALVIAGLWTLDRVDLLPRGKVQTWLARAALLPLVLAAFAAPTALQRGIEWYVDRKTAEILEQFEPVLEPPAPITSIYND